MAIPDDKIVLYNEAVKLEENKLANLQKTNPIKYTDSRISAMLKYIKWDIEAMFGCNNIHLGSGPCQNNTWFKYDGYKDYDYQYSFQYCNDCFNVKCGWMTDLDEVYVYDKNGQFLHKHDLTEGRPCII